MTNSRFEWWRFRRAVRHITTFFGLAMIVLIWGALEFDLHDDRVRLEADAYQSNINLARLFQDQIVRTIKINDRILRSLQLSSVNGTLLADFDRWSNDVDGSSDVTLHLGIIDANGYLVKTSLDPAIEVTDLSDREIFMVHRDSSEAGLVIGKPVRGRVAGKPLLQLTRALRGPHGAFAGVAVASLSPTRLARFYESVDIGPGGAISLVGLDGTIRANAGFNVDAVGQSILGSELLRRAGLAEEGNFRNRGVLDGIMRLISYRVVDGFPLVLWVGRAENEVFGDYWHNSYAYRATASGLTLFILIVILINVRHRSGLESAREELRASEALAREKAHELELTLDHMNQGIMVIDPEHNVALVNRQVVQLLGLPDGMLERHPKFQEVVAYQREMGEFDTDRAVVEPQVRSFIDSGGVSREADVYERVRPNGVVLEVCSVPLPDGGLLRTFTDISERKINEGKIAYMAHHDALTGLANRILMRSDIETALRRQRRQGEGCALLLIDLDHFKQVNDTLGHAAGDELLRVVAQRLQGCVRDTDTVARLGGDEFAVLQVAPDGRDGIEALALRIVEVVGAPYMIDGSSATVGASIGIARSEDSPDIEQMFHNADLALYRVKSEGRNGFRLFEPEMDKAAQARRQMEDDLREARDRGELEIYYQPVFDLASGRIVNVEALLRWNHPLRGRLAPADFIPLAEEIGIMPAIDAWVLETACAEVMRWPGEIEIAVNLSPAKFKRRTLVDVVRRTLAASGLPARRLELEISERTLLHGDDASITVLQALHDLGVRIALDDFGTGHSSLSDLRAFAFDKIKIDQTFVADIERADCAAIVAAIAGLGRSLGVQTTAEGVETETQARLVRAAGCTQAQGYLYSRPLAVSAIRSMLAEPAMNQQAVA